MNSATEPKVELLNPKNYPKWQFIMKTMLQAHEIPAFDDAWTPQMRSYQKSNAKALLLIRSSIGDDVLPHIMQIDDAKETWNLLNTKYGAVSLDNRMDKLVQLFSVKKTEEQTFVGFISGKKLIFNELNMNPLVINNQEFRLWEEVLVASILSGLPDHLQQEILRWEDKNFNLNSLESKLNASYQEKSDLVLNINKNKNPTRRKTIQCYFCKKFGHGEAKCWLKNPELKKKKPVGVLFINNQPHSNNGLWILDSGSACHIVRNRSRLNKPRNTSTIKYHCYCCKW